MLFSNLLVRFVSILRRPQRRANRRAGLNWRFNSSEKLEDRSLLSPTYEVLKDIGIWSDKIYPLPSSNALIFGVETFDTETPGALWVTDGTATGTFKLREFQFLSELVDRGSAVEFQGETYFGITDYADSPDIGLWKTDGTVEGTVLVAGLDGPPANLIVMGNRLYFTGYDDEAGWELWTSNGTAVGTHRVLDLLPGQGNGLDSFGGEGMAVMNGKLYFSGQSTPANLELWSSDGTAEGTQLVKEIYPGSYFVPFDGSRDSSSRPTNLKVINGKLVFTASDHMDPDNLFEYTLWFSDGTSDGTLQYKHINGTVPGTSATEFTSPEILGEYDGLLYFSGETDDPRSSGELWATDGTASGTRFIKEIKPGANQSHISYLAGSNGLVYFSAGDGTHGDHEPWVTDGTSAGTRLLKDIYTGKSRFDDIASSRPERFTPFGDKYTAFLASDKNGSELWVTDGTSSGTIRTTDIVKGLIASDVLPYATVGESLLFFANDGVRTKLFQLRMNATSSGQIPSKTFDVAESAISGTFVGEVEFSGRKKKKLKFSVVSGDPEGAFAIDPASGKITIKNAAALNNEAKSKFTLTVQVTKKRNKPPVATGIITIRIQRLA